MMQPQLLLLLFCSMLSQPAHNHMNLFQPKCYNLIFSSNYICQHQDVSSPKWQREICASWENNCVLFSRICQSET